MRSLLTLASVMLFTVSAMAQLPGYVPANGLVAWYPFSGNANDASGHDYNPTYIGTGVTLTTDRHGIADKAYNFDGTSYLRIPADNFPVTDRTVSVWFNVPTITNKPLLLGYGGQGYLGYGTSFLMGLNISGMASYQAQGHYNSNEINYYYGQEPLSKWINFVITISGNTIKMYINGILKQTSTTFSSSTYTTGTDFVMGVMPGANGIAPYTDANGGYLQGKLDDVGVWDRALTQCEIFSLYNEGSATSASNADACKNYTAPDGAVYTTSGIKTAVIQNYVGCDSTITIDLTIKNIDVSVNQVNNVLTAVASPATYRWLDCNNSNIPLPGETSRIFTAAANGSYSVEITKDGCVDISSCYNVTITGTIENTFENAPFVYPNPVNDHVSVDFGALLAEVELLITDTGGRIFKKLNYKEVQRIDIGMDLPAGVYLMSVRFGDKKTTLRLIKN
jgi:hypothetical protein